jgi:hypothetical protein
VPCDTCVRSVVPAAAEVVMVSPPTTLCSTERAQRQSRAREGSTQSAAKVIIETGVLHLASLQRRGLILRESCYKVVTRAPSVGNDCVVPHSKRERGVHARYALLGTRRAGGGRRPGDRLGAVPIGPPLALAASRGPGFASSTPPRPVNGERGTGWSARSLMGNSGTTPT